MHLRVALVAIVSTLSCGAFRSAASDPDAGEPPTDGSADDPSTNDAAGVIPDAGAVVLFGSTRVAADYWYNEPPGVPATAFQYDARYTGTVTRISVFLDARTTAGCRVQVGMYDDKGGHPGTLLTRGTVASAAKDAWNTATVPPAVVTAGQRYWLAFLNPGGVATLAFRITGDGTLAVDSAPDLEDLPSTWTTKVTFTGSPGAAYASQ